MNPGLGVCAVAALRAGRSREGKGGAEAVRDMARCACTGLVADGAAKGPSPCAL